MCQGGRTSTSAAIELFDFFKASAIVHPSLVSNDEAPLVKIPMYLLPSSAQPDMVNVNDKDERNIFKMRLFSFSYFRKVAILPNTTE